MTYSSYIDWYPLPLRFGNFVVNLDGILLIELLLRSQVSTVTFFIKKYAASGTCVKSQLDRSENTRITLHHYANTPM